MYTIKDILLTVYNIHVLATPMPQYIKIALNYRYIDILNNTVIVPGNYNLNSFINARDAIFCVKGTRLYFAIFFEKEA